MNNNENSIKIGKNSNPNKSRDIDVYSLFKILQYEYIVAELRRKIYPHSKDKEYYQKVMKLKKERIDDISIRNTLRSIFNDEEKKKEYCFYIYGKNGFPNFIYKDECDKNKFEDLDRENYYFPNTHIKVTQAYGEYLIGQIVDVDLFHEEASIELESGELKKFKLNLITRIL